MGVATRQHSSKRPISDSNKYWKQWQESVESGDLLEKQYYSVIAVHQSEIGPV